MEKGILEVDIMGKFFIFVLSIILILFLVGCSVGKTGMAHTTSASGSQTPTQPISSSSNDPTPPPPDEGCADDKHECDSNGECVDDWDDCLDCDRVDSQVTCCEEPQICEASSADCVCEDCGPSGVECSDGTCAQSLGECPCTEQCKECTQECTNNGDDNAEPTCHDIEGVDWCPHDEDCAEIDNPSDVGCDCDNGFPDNCPCYPTSEICVETCTSEAPKEPIDSGFELCDRNYNSIQVCRAEAEVGDCPDDCCDLDELEAYMEDDWTPCNFYCDGDTCVGPVGTRWSFDTCGGICVPSGKCDELT